MHKLILPPLLFYQLATITCLVTLTAARPRPKSPPLVDLNYTKYEGLRLFNGVNAFLGMRYAAPPVGDLRWRAPAEPPQTKIVEKATKVCITTLAEKLDCCT